jgi:SAM-dependent methyltransferase
MSLRSDYDLWHTRNQNLNPDHDDASSPWYVWVREVLPEVKGLRVLEVACGRGGFVVSLARSGAFAYGMDFSFAAVKAARGKILNERDATHTYLLQGDAHALPFPDGYFDLVISCETIEHLPSPLKALGEFYRVARPGGRLFLTTPNYFNFMGLYEIYAKFRHSERKRDQPFDRLQIFTQIRKQLNDTGWRIIGADGTVHQLPILPGRNPVRLPNLESNLRLRRFLSIFALHYCLIAKKI